MLARIKSSLEYQTIFLAAAALISFLICRSVHLIPQLRVSLFAAESGVLAGIGWTAITFLFYGAGKRLRPAAFSALLRQRSAELKEQSPFALFGAALTAGIGEELLFRGCVFGLLLRQSFWLAFAVNAALTGAAYFRRSSAIPVVLLRMSEATFYGIFYFFNKSLFAVGLAHFIVEAGEGIFLRTWQGRFRLGFMGRARGRPL